MRLISSGRFQFSEDGERWRRERLVELEQVDVAELQSRLANALRRPALGDAMISDPPDGGVTFDCPKTQARSAAFGADIRMLAPPI